MITRHKSFAHIKCHPRSAFSKGWSERFQLAHVQPRLDTIQVTPKTNPVCIAPLVGFWTCTFNYSQIELEHCSIRSELYVRLAISITSIMKYIRLIILRLSSYSYSYCIYVVHINILFFDLMLWFDFSAYLLHNNL